MNSQKRKLFFIEFVPLHFTDHWSNELSVRQWSGRPGFNPRPNHTKDSKMILDATLLSTMHYKVRIKDKMK